MIAIIIAWITISIVFLSSGNFIVFVYQKLFKRNENYGYTDTFLLGICFTLVLLSVTSFFLPSNQYILFFYLILCIIYWIYRKEHLYDIISKSKKYIQTLSLSQKIAFAISIVSIGAIVLWTSGAFDPAYYHYQAIRWNEDYPIIPGLANLEDRFGFNSNYMLLSAPFTFRFIFGEAIYSLQSLLAVYIT